MSETSTGKLAGKLAKVMAAVSRLPKSGHNDAQNYDFVTDADVLEAIRKELSSQNVAVVSNVGDVRIDPYTTSRGNAQFLVTVQGSVEFIDGDSGESIVALAAGQGADSGDKGIYKAITGMVKYALLKTFLVPTGDDPENETDEERSAKQGRSASRGSRPSRDLPAEAQRVVEAAERAGLEVESAEVEGLTDKQKRLLAVRFKEAGLEGQQRVAFLFEITGKGSSKQLTGADLDKVLAALQDADLVQKARDDVKPEAA